jgi:hypothetical protein
MHEHDAGINDHGTWPKLPGQLHNLLSQQPHTLQWPLMLVTPTGYY